MAKTTNLKFANEVAGSESNALLDKAAIAAEKQSQSD